MEATKNFFSNFAYGVYLMFYVSDFSLTLVVYIQDALRCTCLYSWLPGLHMVSVEGEKRWDVRERIETNEPIPRPILLYILTHHC